MLKLCLAFVISLVLATTTLFAVESAPHFPQRDITIIIPFAPGGGLDLSTRLLARYAAPKLGATIHVVNRTKGGNIKGNLEGINARPDGYTLLIWGSGLYTDELLVRNAPYTHRDVAPVCGYANDPEVLVVDREFADTAGIASFDDLLRYVRANPGLVTIAMGGNWTAHDLFRLRIEYVADIKFNRMPFLGGRLALEAAARGNANVANCFVAEYMGLPKEMRERVVPLVVAHDERMALLPDVPCVAELGYPDMAQSMWRMVTAPRHTPGPIIAKLEGVIAEVLRDRRFLEEAAGMGFNPVFMGARDMAAFLDEQHNAEKEILAKFGAIGVKEVEEE